MSPGLTFDAGGLIAVERRHRRVRLLIDEAVRAGHDIAVPVGPLAQVVVTSDPGDMVALDPGLPLTTG